MELKHDLIPADDGNQMAVVIDGQAYWAPAIPYPFFTTKGLPIWKRFNEKNWRPQCKCERIFDTLQDYYAHVVYFNSVYGRGNIGG